MAEIKKIDIFDWLYEKNGEVWIIVDTKAENLRIPENHYEYPNVTFIISAISSPNFTYDNYNINAPMSFNKMKYHCVFPWESIIRITDNKEVIVAYRTNKENRNKTQPSRPNKPSNNKKQTVSYLKRIK